MGMLNKLESDHDLLKALHIILYKGPGAKLTRKKDIRAFNGYARGTDVGAIKTKVLENKKWTVSVLKDACVLLGLEKGGDREQLVNRLFDFLVKPHPIAKPAPPKVRPSVSPSVGGIISDCPWLARVLDFDRLPPTHGNAPDPESPPPPPCSTRTTYRRSRWRRSPRPRRPRRPRRTA